jgi:drug/metabolite transporter (DMT)-like permease
MAIPWAVYTLRGRAAGSDPLTHTARNFTATVPIAAGLWLLSLIMLGGHASARGVGLACTSGALASGLGYTLWYRALPHLRVTTAATLQLLVPVLAAVGGVLLLAEHPDRRLLIAGLAILFGVAVTILGRDTARAKPSER